jgi:hypothetical protein
MAKVQGSYSSIIKGVSQQAPADRLEGQHSEMLNMVSDPVRGVVRRNGFIMENQQVSEFSADPNNGLSDSFSYRVFPFRVDDTPYDLLYRSRPRVGAVTDAHLDPLVLHRKTVGAPLFMPVVRDPADTLLDTFEAEGFSAMTTIGAYLLLASNGVAPSYNTEEGLNNLGWKNTGAIWVRGGGYSHTYSVIARRASDGAEFNISYTTPQVNFPGVLDLTLYPPFDVAIGTPYEQYFVNAIQAQYDTAVNQWSAMATAAIVPSAIATVLAQKLSDAGFPGWSVVGSHLIHDNTSYLEVNDGGNGENLMALVTDAKDAADMTDIHRIGKVIRVSPNDGESDPYYLKAYAKVPGSSAPFQTVIWREAAGVVQKPAQILAMGRIVNGKLYWASTPAKLNALVLSLESVDLQVPDYVDSTAGDLDSVTPPAFFGKRITMLTVFQDRLLIGSGSVINASEKGDYFNFYRTTVLTIPASDPIEMFAQGTESDVIRKAVVYDKNLTLYGDQFHYAINGKAALDASNPSMSVQFAIASSADAQPVGIGKFVYVLKEDSQLAASRLLQVQAGIFADTPDLKDVSQQLRDYINGTPAEIVAMSSPSLVFVRTEHFLKSQGGFPRARPWGIYLYQYLDNDQGQRLTDAWGAWEWSTTLGTPIGMSDAGTGDAILLYTYAFGANENNGPAKAIHVLKASARPDPTGLPYLDGLRVAADAEANGLFTPGAVEAVRNVTFTSPGAAHSYSPVPAVNDASRFAGLEHPNYSVGDGPAEAVDPYRWSGVQGWRSDYVLANPLGPNDNLWTGVAYPAYIDVTNPFVRDKDGKAMTQGSLTLTHLKVTLTRTAGFASSWIDYDGTKVNQTIDGHYERIQYKQDVFVGRDTKDVQVRLSAEDWYPLTINGIEWQGNWYGYKGRA